MAHEQEATLVFEEERRVSQDLELPILNAFIVNDMAFKFLRIRPKTEGKGRSLHPQLQLAYPRSESLTVRTGDRVINVPAETKLDGHRILSFKIVRGTADVQIGSYSISGQTQPVNERPGFLLNIDSPISLEIKPVGEIDMEDIVRMFRPSSRIEASDVPME